jgi:hypothetical protein
MAAGYTPRLGQGPFDVCPTCEHTDCRANRALIASECRWCHQPLGEQTRFYYVPDGNGGQTAAHANCEEDRVS